jgi:threonine dehydrogenase-like Zn-dependent dehydrogenase
VLPRWLLAPGCSHRPLLPPRPPCPAANTNLLRVPQGPDDEHYLFLSDILPTAWHACEMGEVAAGDCVAIWGAGPVGILAAHCAQYRWAAAAVTTAAVAAAAVCGCCR